MEQKNLVASLFLKNGEAVTGYDTAKSAGDVRHLVKLYNDSGLDKLLIFDLSDEDEEHEVNINIIKELNRMLEIPVCGGGNISRLEDIKKLLYAGCAQVMLNSSKSITAQLAEDGCKRFGKEKMALSVQNVDLFFKHRETIEANISELYVIKEDIVDTISNVTDIPYTVMQDTYNLERWVSLLQKTQTRGVCGTCLNEEDTDIMKIKMELSQNGIKTEQFESSMKWSSFKTDSQGLVPVIVQDYQSLEVLMLAYMNQEAYEATIASGRMTYYSRSREELWTKGETSGHYQYLKSLKLDCDNDTILAKISQVGAACHTGSYSCFFQELVKKDYLEKNTLRVFENVYSVIDERKQYPKEGSYTNYLFDKGLDKILKKIGEEATEIVIASKNPNPEEIKYEISDFLYHTMVLMVEKGITWEDIARELSER